MPARAAKSMQLACAALAAMALAPAWCHAAAPDPALIGCWQSTRIVLHLRDGSTTEDKSGRCALQFTEGQVESRCKTSSGTATTTYDYRIVRPNVYSTTLTGSTFRTDLVGSVREYEYRVLGERLYIASTPQAAAPAPAPAAARVETEAVKVGCGNA